jgi:hypothetical protein
LLDVPVAPAKPSDTRVSRIVTVFIRLQQLFSGDIEVVRSSAVLGVPMVVLS